MVSRPSTTSAPPGGWQRRRRGCCLRGRDLGRGRGGARSVYGSPAPALNPLLSPVFHPGRRENGERSHQPESGGARRLRGAVQNQAAHPAEQADEGILRAAGRLGSAGLLLPLPACPFPCGTVPGIVETSLLLCLEH